jgi:enterochelin esterase-like enzyme
MRRMSNRQAKLFNSLTPLLLLIAACSTPTDISPTQTLTPPPPPTATATPTPVPPTATSTPLTCLTQPGTIEEGKLTDFTPPQTYLIYLPPCYSEFPDNRYPVLYLLHGQTYTQDQWLRLGAATIADRLIHKGESVPFMIVFPDDRYWNLQAGPGFGWRLVNAVVPLVDETYRTLPNREHRFIGGLSRGGGWAIQLGFEHVDLFGTIGLHSPAIFKEDAPSLTRMLKGIPEEARPRLWMDTGDSDSGLESILQFEQVLTENHYLHEFYRYAGDHSEDYWGAHVEEYLRWYVEPWNEIDVE